MIYFYSLALLFSTASISAMHQQSISLDDIDSSNLTLIVPSSKVSTQNINNKIELLCDNKGFIVKENEAVKRVHSYDTDAILRNKDIKDIAKFAMCLSKFKVSRLDNGDFKLYAHGSLNGGGIGGATLGFYVGRIGVSFLGHGTILVVSAMTGPAAKATFYALESTFGASIEATANAAGVGLAVIAGTTTGPV